MWARKSKGWEHATDNRCALAELIEMLRDSVAEDSGYMPGTIASEFADLIARAKSGDDPAKLSKAAARLLADTREHRNKRVEESTSKLFGTCRELVESLEEGIECSVSVAAAAQRAVRNLRYFDESTSREDMLSAIEVETRNLVVAIKNYEHHSDNAGRRALDAIEQMRERLSTACSFTRIDPQTELPNRKAFESYLLSHLQGGGEAESAVGLADIGGFGDIDVAIGPSKADDLLKSVASSLKQALEPGGFVARLGGYTFGIAYAGSATELNRRLEYWASTLPRVGGGQLVASHVALASEQCPSASTILSDLEDALLATKRRKDFLRETA